MPSSAGPLPQPGAVQSSSAPAAQPLPKQSVRAASLSRLLLVSIENQFLELFFLPRAARHMLVKSSQVFLRPIRSASIKFCACFLNPPVLEPIYFYAIFSFIL